MANERDVPGGYAREVRDTVIKSGLTGVAATALVVTIFSPAGLGGMIGTSVASSLGLDTSANAASAEGYANLPPYPAPLSSTELSDIRSQLAQTTASLEITRAATESRIEYIRSIADVGDARGTPMPEVRMPDLRGTAPIDAAVAPAPQAVAQPASDGGGADTTVPYRDPNMELAALLFAHENY